jgi:hypothetical protein
MSIFANRRIRPRKGIFWFCALFPPAWLTYYLGGFDFYMAHITRGGLKEMSADWKKAALPFGLVYGMVTVVVIRLSSGNQCRRNRNSSMNLSDRDSAPFLKRKNLDPTM